MKLILGMSDRPSFSCLAETRQSYQAPPPAHSAFSADSQIQKSIAKSKSEVLEANPNRAFESCDPLPHHDTPSVPHIWIEWKEASKRSNKIRSWKNISGSLVLGQKSVTSMTECIETHQNAQFDGVECGTMWYMNTSVVNKSSDTSRHLKTSIPSLPSPACPQQRKLRVRHQGPAMKLRKLTHPVARQDPYALEKMSWTKTRFDLFGSEHMIPSTPWTSCSASC